jgi:hypothetical protein
MLVDVQVSSMNTSFFYAQRGQRFDPRSARLLHVLAFLLAGVQGFF